MKSSTKILSVQVLALAVAATLVACGGGGSSSTPAPSTATNPAVQPSTLVTSVAAATYSGDTASAFNRLNAERLSCGFGLVAQNFALDKSAAAHSLYEVTNNIGGHTETPGAPGFTGVNPADRAAVAGYVGGYVGEGMWIGPNGDDAMRGMLSGVFHGIGMLAGYREVGVSVRVWPVVTSSGTFTNNNTLVVDIGTPTGTPWQMLGPDVISTYPCEGSSGLVRMIRGESPNPVPGRDIANNPLGTPIFVMVQSGKKLAITSAALIQVGGGAVPLRDPFTVANNPTYFQSNTAAIVPDVPLAANTKYQATIAASVDGVPFPTRTFSFTTGAN